MPHPVPLLALATLLAAALSSCSSAGSTSSGSTSAERPAEVVGTPTPGPTGPVSEQALEALLLQPADLPTLPDRRVFASAALSTQPTPQLALCKPQPEVAPHQVTNVIAQSGQMGQVVVFQTISVFLDDAGAAAAFAAAAASARGCPSFTQDGVAYTTEDIGAPRVAGATQTLAYRLAAGNEVSGDVRTLAQVGPHLVTLTGYGAPPPGQTLLEFQAGVMARAVARLS